MLNPKALTDKLDTLTEKISQLNERLEKKDKYIAALEARLSSCEADLDQLEQYSRRTNEHLVMSLTRSLISFSLLFCYVIFIEINVMVIST